MFDIEITSNCNKSCRICPRDRFLRNGRTMRDDTFGLLLSWLPTDCDIMLAGFGEPLLNPHCAGYVRRLTDTGRSCTILTNGKKLTGSLVDQLFDCGLNKLQISILPDEGMDQILKFVPIIKPGLRSRVCFNVIIGNPDLHIVNTSEVLDLGFLIDFKKVHNRAGALCPGIPSSDLKTCGTYFSVSFISADGDIFNCSNDINGQYPISNIRDMSFGKLLEYKSRMLGNKPVCNLCYNCTDEYRVINFKGLR